MADIRIKDLTTLESASLSGDVFVIDGSTGTRKLSAFSPSFGGNATVTGTLTVNSSSPSVFTGQVRSNLSSSLVGDAQVYVRNAAASATNGAVSQAVMVAQPGYTTFVGTTGDGTSASYQGGVLGSAILFSEGYVITDAANGLLLHGINGAIRLATGNPGSVKATFDSAGTLSLTATTASTTTSSGALVVSGGVGVAKGMVVGDQLRVTNASIPDLWLQNTSGATSAYRNILLRQNSDDTFKFLSTSDAGVLSKDNILTGSNANGAIGIGVAPGAGTSSLTVAGVIKTNDTTASTSTSSGSLVCSGGVGVAGAGFFGGNIVAAGNVVCGSATNQAVSIAGGTANDGGNVIIYGSTHASDPNTGRIRVGTTTITSWDSNDLTIASGKGLKVGNAYVAGAPTATGYIVIKDSTGTSYKIPAVAL